MIADLSSLKVGDEIPGFTFGPVTREILARYAAASGDFNPIHIDIDFARAAGEDDVFAHGMLSFGLAARALHQWVASGHVRRLAAKFTAITRVGSMIAVTGRIAAIHDGKNGKEAEINIVTVADDETTVVATALIALD